MCQIHGVGILITKHKKWATRGRYSVHTTERHFDEGVRIIGDNLVQWNQEAVERENIDLSDLEVKHPRVALRSDVPEPGINENDDSEARSFQSSDIVHK